MGHANNGLYTFMLVKDATSGLTKTQVNVHGLSRLLIVVPFELSQHPSVSKPTETARDQVQEGKPSRGYHIYCAVPVKQH